MIQQMHNIFGEFFRVNTELPAATTKKMVDVLNDPSQYRKLKMELAMTVDGMEPFVKAIYMLLKMTKCSPWWLMRESVHYTAT